MEALTDMRSVIFDSKKSEYKEPFGAVPCGEDVRLSIKAERTGVHRLCLVMYFDDEKRQMPMYWESFKLGFDVFSVKIKAPKAPGLIWYYFKIEKNDGEVLYFGKNDIAKSESEVRAFQITVYSKEYETPSWFSEGVTYHVFVDRFFRAKASGEISSDKDFYVHRNLSDIPQFRPNENGVVENRDIYGGNIEGICEKLPYLNSLGVRTIYLSPIFEAWSNHKYDTADYMKIDAHFGNESSLVKLCKEAEKYGIRIILDGVFNHTGADSVYFNKNGRYSGGAWNDINSPYRAWYGIDTDGRYSSWWGIDTLPQVNEENPGYMDFIIRRDDSVISHWMDAGVSGWRLDVADELPDNFIRALKEKVREKKHDGIVIGEVWEDASTKEAYGVKKKYFTDGILDGVMNYPLKNAIIDFLCGNISAREMSGRLSELLGNYPPPSQRCLMNIIGTHDTVRAINALSVGNGQNMRKEERAEYTLSRTERELGKTRLFQAATLQYMFPGSPCIYYGDEIGMEGFEDPFNRRYFTWDKCGEDILSFYRALGEIKKNELCMHNGAFKILFARDDVISVMRGKMSEHAVVAVVNRGEKTRFLRIDGKYNFKKKLGIGELKNGIIKINPFSSCIYVKE